MTDPNMGLRSVSQDPAVNGGDQQLGGVVGVSSSNSVSVQHPSHGGDMDVSGNHTDPDPKLSESMPGTLHNIPKEEQKIDPNQPAHEMLGNLLKMKSMKNRKLNCLPFGRGRIM